MQCTAQQVRAAPPFVQFRAVLRCTLMGDDHGWRVDPASPVYVYMQVADRIAELIEDGTLHPGARLPGELDLAEEYGVSKDTARRAIKVLRERGLAVTVPYKGTFIQTASADTDGAADTGSA